MSRIQTQPTNRIVKPFISPQALISSDNQSLSEVIILSFFMNDNPSKDTCSIVAIIVVTSMQTDRQSIYGVCHEYLNGAIHGLWGIAAHHERHIRPHGNFMTSSVLWCLSSSCLSSIMNQSSMNDESSILYPLVFPLDCHVGIVSLSY